MKVADAQLQFVLEDKIFPSRSRSLLCLGLFYVLIINGYRWDARTAVVDCLNFHERKWSFLLAENRSQFALNGVVDELPYYMWR